MKKYKSDLSEATLKWIINIINTNASIEEIFQLPGSTSSTLYSILLKYSGQLQHCVLRMFSNTQWLTEEPDAALHEVDSLNYLQKNDLPVPKLIAFDKTGEICGIPLILMTKLSGNVDLKPHDQTKWLDELAKILVKIHKVRIDNFKWKYFKYMDITQFKLPTWSEYPNLWKQLIAIAKKPPPISKICFIHRDYHPANVLWQQNEVSGIVDWPSACLGPAGVDVGHCRVNLAQLFDVKTADDFLTAYQKYAGNSFDYDPYWDIIALIDILFGTPKVYTGWVAFGITCLTDKLIQQRIDNYMMSLLEKL